jgi:hypothetical protein
VRRPGAFVTVQRLLSVTIVLIGIVIAPLAG